MVNLETELRFVTPVPGKIDLGAADCVTEKGDQVIRGEKEYLKKKEEKKEENEKKKEEKNDDQNFCFR